MTAIVQFFNSALIYLSNGIRGNVNLTFPRDSNSYENAKENLDAVVRKYDQAVFHLAALVVASTLSLRFSYLFQKKSVRKT